MAPFVQEKGGWPQYLYGLMIVQWRAYDQMPSYLILNMFGEFEMLTLSA
jgi:hypothetical protein